MLILFNKISFYIGSNKNDVFNNGGDLFVCGNNNESTDYNDNAYDNTNDNACDSNSSNWIDDSGNDGRKNLAATLLISFQPFE